MYTAFMVALTMTTVANVLITMALAPLFTALLARFALGHRLPARTWAAIVAAGLGIAWMYGGQVGGGDLRHLGGIAVALGVPLAAAANWTLLQRMQRRSTGEDAGMLNAVLVGALLSALLTLPFARPLSVSAHDIGWLSLLGLVQLAVPCLMAVVAARALAAPEAALLSLLEVVFGVAWAWAAGERPGPSALAGGLVVLVALAANEAVALARSRSSRTG
jgi:drug/metabolite transporter (DMT)-like permease